MNQWKTQRQQNILGCFAQPTYILRGKNSLGITVLQGVNIKLRLGINCRGVFRITQRGCQLQRGASYYLAKISRKLHENKKIGLGTSKILLCISATELHGTHPRIHKAVGPDIVTAEIFAYDSTGICRRSIWLHITCAVVLCWIGIVNIYDESISIFTFTTF